MALFPSASQQPPERHFGYVCRNCNAAEFQGRRYACWSCIDYQICGKCFDAGLLPISPDHKYYHPLETHYTRDEFELYFGGEPYLDAKVPQSYMCAFCETFGFSNADLCKHLKNTHQGHKDFKDYFNMIYSRFAADASASPFLLSGPTLLTPTSNVQAEQPPPVLEILPPTAESKPAAKAKARLEDDDGKGTVKRCVLEVIRPPMNAERKSHRETIDYWIRLLDELNTLSRSYADDVDHCYDILRKAQGLRRQQIHTYGDNYSCPELDTFIRIIEEELASLLSARHKRQATNGGRVSITSLAVRRGGLIPGSNATTAANTMAAATVPFRPATPSVTQQSFTLEPASQLMRRPPPLPFSFNPNAQQLQGVSNTTQTSAMSSLFNRVYVDEAMHSSEAPLFRATSNNLASTASNYSRAAAPYRNVDGLNFAPRSSNKVSTPCEDIVREMASTREYRPVLMEVVNKVKARGKTVAKDKEKPAETPSQSHTTTDPEENRFLCSRLTSLETTPLKVQTENQLNQASFMEALLCSMLSEEELVQLPRASLLRHRKLPENKLEKTSVMLFKDKSSEKVTNDALDLRVMSKKSSVAIMETFYKGLNNYKKWLNDFMAQKQQQQSTESSAPAPKQEVDPSQQHTLPPPPASPSPESLQPTSANEHEENGAFFVPVMNETPNPIVYVDSDLDADSDEDEEHEDDENSNAGQTINQPAADDSLNSGIQLSVDGVGSEGEVDEDVGEEEDEGEEEEEEEEEAEGEEDGTESEMSESTIAQLVDHLEQGYSY